jgi:ribA/ribD-fused uncharacterized protein
MVYKETEMIAKFFGENRFLSNFYTAPIRAFGVMIPTVEHGFQAAKTVDFEQRDLILTAPTAKDAKHLGRECELRPDWEDAKEIVMHTLLRRKFQLQNLKRLLLNTGVKKLIEGNTWGDVYWGMCNGVGQNRLGILLMRVRHELTVLNGL